MKRYAQPAKRCPQNVALGLRDDYCRVCPLPDGQACVAARRGGECPYVLCVKRGIERHNVRQIATTQARIDGAVSP